MPVLTSNDVIQHTGAVGLDAGQRAGAGALSGGPSASHASSRHTAQRLGLSTACLCLSHGDALADTVLQHFLAINVPICQVSIPYHPIASHPIPSHPIPSHPIPSHQVFGPAAACHMLLATLPIDGGTALPSRPGTLGTVRASRTFLR